MLILEPTIEFEPWQWVGESAHEKIGTDEWNDYWTQHLSDIGIKSICPGAWFVSINELSSFQLLKKLVLLVLNESGVIGFPDSDGEETDDDSDRLMPFTGGYVLRSNDEILFTPQCCCDLGDLEYWEEIVEISSIDWQCIVMGHAMMEARRVGEKIEIRENHEYGNHEPIFELVDVLELRSAVRTAENKISHFKEKLVPVLMDIFDDELRAINISQIVSGWTCNT